MKIIVSSEIKVIDPPVELQLWCDENLVVDNPEYITRQKNGLWLGSTPKKLSLTKYNLGELTMPFGCLDYLWKTYRGKADFVPRFAPTRQVNYGSNIELYDYQERAVQAALKARNGIIVAPCGAGKTQIGLELVARLGVKTLWITNKQDLLSQSMERAKANFELPEIAYGTITAGKISLGQITFATVQTLANVDLTKLAYCFDCIVTDECFPKGTKISTPTGEKELTNLCKGDIITSYNRHTRQLEYKPITHIFKHKAHNIVKVRLTSGQEIVCTSNHPFYVKGKGWISAEKLGGNDYVMCLLRKRVRHRNETKDHKTSYERKGLRLLQQRVFAQRGETKYCLYAGMESERFSAPDGIQLGTPRRNIRENENQQSHAKAGNKGNGIKTLESNRTPSQDKVWQWNWAYCTATNANVGVGGNNGSVCGISDTNENAERQRLSTLLQNRHCIARTNDCDRGGRQLTSSNRPSKTRPQKRRFSNWVRVESVEVQEQTSDGTFGGLCSDGYVYNIEVADNNNYFANGVLVHNCHHLVGTPTAMTQFYKVLSKLSARYKFGLTATPKRADGLEKTMFSIVGEKVYEITKEDVAEKVVPIKVELHYTGYRPDENLVTASDGTLVYSSLLSNLCESQERTETIAEVIQQQFGTTLVLSDRRKHLEALHSAVNEPNSIILKPLNGSKKSRQERKESLERFNNGEIKIIFATYSIAKEGLDVPSLNNVVLASPCKDQITVQQACGRVGRKADGKKYGTVLDFTDSFGLLFGAQKKRKTIYKKLGYEIIDKRNH